jgi:hypothetical protein
LGPQERKGTDFHPPQISSSIYIYNKRLVISFLKSLSLSLKIQQEEEEEEEEEEAVIKGENGDGKVGCRDGVSCDKTRDG